MSTTPAQPSGIEPIFISVKQAAEVLGISVWTMNKLLNRQDSPIESRYQGSRRLVPVNDLRAYAETLPTSRPSVVEGEPA